MIFDSFQRTVNMHVEAVGKVEFGTFFKNLALM